ncbi:hypothetical protein SSBR45G_62550 [Bradyrhizobium sp. SSBR45G]|uniref:hypothetical protein n=1 Tax=unclassified Bradyrhizobium TaxID=2631580 RepID=UPI0023429C1D|nr:MULTISPECIES: hypothetical protein [unclassified Bradyrhizobium]GLH81346.1 hypothetical protein SSBR45G_62550 [Bradyrhizobium sp. SSBR45G]GLH85866.1 hypothetical protein SSBR45R_33260 [Bradyrhizobium sp. SSBR45R]
MLKSPVQWLPRKPCSTCGRPTVVRNGPHEAKTERRAPLCPICDGPDPLHSPKALGWARGSLRPPQRPQKR